MKPGREMSLSVIDAIVRHSREQPDSPALIGRQHALGYLELATAIEKLGAQLRAAPARTMALALDNSPLWAVLDLACLHAGKPVVPLPFFFSAAQVAHSIRDAGIDCILTDQPEQYQKFLRRRKSKPTRNWYTHSTTRHSVSSACATSP